MKLDNIAEAYRLLYITANASDLYEVVLTEDRIDYLKSKWPAINTSHDSSAIHRNPSDIIDFLSSEVDPHPKKAYTQWLVNRYHSGGFRQEDAPRVKEILSTFDVRKSGLPEHMRDIGQYRKISDVAHAVSTATTVPAHPSTMDDEPGFKKNFEDSNIKIHELSNTETSQRLFGKPMTEWCTAWHGSSCRFNETVHGDEPGPLFVVTRKKDNAVFQYHPTSDQFMDADNNTVEPHDFESMKDSLHTAWSQNPHLLSK